MAVTDLGRELRAEPRRFVSRRAGHRFLGYLRAQRERMTGGRGHTNRRELVDTHGFDTKFAHHMVRLGLQGVELMERERMSLPMPEPDRSWLLSLRRGEHTRQEALERARQLEARLSVLCAEADVPEEPDTDWANRWLVRAHLRTWG